MERPAGPAVYASFLLDALAATGDVELAAGRGLDRAEVILSLDGRFRAGRGQRTVTAILDLGHLFAGDGYGRLEWLAQHWRVTSAARRSDHLIAPSDAVRYGLERYLRVPAKRISVLDPAPRRAVRRPPREQVEALRHQLRLPERYFLFVGTRSRRKNLARLGRAWAAARGQLGPEFGLVLAGPGRGGVAGARDLGYVPLDDLPALIAGAVAWVSPSLYEGSAVGALEAMACGTPPLVAGTGAQARAVGSAGLVLDPRDEDEWTRALVAIASQPPLRQQLSVNSLKAAAELRESGPPAAEAVGAVLGAHAAGR